MKPLREVAKVLPRFHGVRGERTTTLVPGTTYIMGTQHVGRDGLCDMNVPFATMMREAPMGGLYLREGDVCLSVAPGGRYACMSPTIAGYLLAGPTLLAIRPDPAQLLGEYYVAFVNAMMGRAYHGLFDRSMVHNAVAKEILETPIPVPPLDEQKRIAEVYRLAERIVAAKREQHRLLCEMVRALAHTKDPDYVDPKAKRAESAP